MEIINIGHASLNYDMAHQGPTETSGELWLTDLPNLGLLGVGFAVIKQHGSLHCVTMQYPEGVVSIDN